MAISPDGTWLATAGDDRTVRTWAVNGTSRAVLTGHQGAWKNFSSSASSSETIVAQASGVGARRRRDARSPRRPSLSANASGAEQLLRPWNESWTGCQAQRLQSVLSGRSTIVSWAAKLVDGLSCHADLTGGQPGNEPAFMPA